MLGAIYIGLSGMDAYQKGLQTISNNVANLNTLGFKATSINFTDVFNSGGGGLTFSSGTDAEQAGEGVRYGEPRVDFKQGDLKQSDGDLDLAIQGNGFLVLLDGDKTYYARTGQFVVDEDGYISLQGTKYHLAVLDSSREPVALNLDSKRTSPPKATTTVTFADNLSSSGTDATVSNIAVYDSLGGKQVWQVTFTAAGSSTPGQWTVKVTDQNGNQVGDTATLKFIGGSVDPTTEKLTIQGAPSGGAASLSVILDFSQVQSFSAGTVSTIRASDVDGNGVGALTSVTIDEDGQVKLTYSNTKTDLEGAVALADFRDPQQLERVGNGLFENKGGGQYRLLESNTDGIGKLVSKQVEASNVDLAQEFGDLILIQRGFQASSQVVSVSNDMIQQLFGIRGQGG
jgi:flagellar hook protein FlgE